MISEGNNQQEQQEQSTETFNFPYEHGIYELPHELQTNLRLRILEN